MGGIWLGAWQRLGWTPQLRPREGTVKRQADYAQ